MCQVRMPANSEAQAAKMPELVIHSNDHKKLSEMDTAMSTSLFAEQGKPGESKTGVT